MKYRNGFVSNSSSASYIIGIAKIVDENKFCKWIDDNDFKDLLDIYPPEKYTNIQENDNFYYIESFDSDRAIIDQNDVKKGEVVVGFYFSEEPGDYYYIDEDSDNIDYDNVDYESLFTERENSFVDGFNESNGLSHVSIQMGSARNG